MTSGVLPAQVTLSSEDAATVQEALVADERVRWTGVPGRRLQLHGYDAGPLAFAVMWLSFAVFWELQVIHDRGGSLFALSGIPLIAVGLYVVAGRFFYTRYPNRRTVYAITDRRAMSIVRGRAGDTVLALTIDRIAGVFGRPARNGKGIVSFGGPVSWRDGPGMPPFGNRRRGPSYDLAFFDVADPHAVAALVSSKPSEW